MTPSDTRISTPPPATASRKAGIFLVNSGILPSAKPILPLSTFHAWYEKVHIPDLFLTNSVKSAYRFQAVPSSSSSSSSRPSNNDRDDNLDDNPTDNHDDSHGDPTVSGVLDKRPFLAIYPVDVNWLADDASPVWQVPVTSEILPGPPGGTEGGNIFALGDFQMGLFEKVLAVQVHSSAPFPASAVGNGNGNGNGTGAAGKFVVLVGVDAQQVERIFTESDAGKEPGDNVDAKTALENSVPVPSGGQEGATTTDRPRPVRSILFKWIEYSPPGAPKAEGTEGKVGTPLSGFQSFLAVHEYDELPGNTLLGKDEAPVYVFSAISSLGDVSQTW